MGDRTLNLTSPSPRYGTRKRLRHILADSDAIARIDDLAAQFSVSRSELIEQIGRGRFTLDLPATGSPEGQGPPRRHAAWVTDDGWAGVKELARKNQLSLKGFFALFSIGVTLLEGPLH